MDINNITAVYFIGAGGIGMSALIRYFLSKGKKVGGYDKTPSGLTEQLNYEGAAIHYEDNVDLIPDDFTDPVKTLVVYTPAVPEDHSELCYFRGNGFEVMKRARVLGEITGCNRGLCVAGTHGKTTTSSMVAHLLKQSHVDCNAFLGGILKNYDSNLMLSDKSDLTVIEADEFDRSFHWLKPYMAVITAADPDHLDIYGTPEAYRESFEHFTSLIRPDGCLLMKQGINVTPRLQEGVKFYTYTGAFDAKELSTFNFQLSTGSPDFYAENVRIGGGEIFFDFVGPDVRIPDIQLGVPVKVNVENGVAAIALAWLNGVTPEEIKRQEQLRRHRIKSRERYQKIKAGEHAVGQPFKLICKCCGEEFESKRSNTLFCSPKCRTKFYRQEAAENRKRECVCENCGKTFTATRKDVKYCCDDCRTEANRRMQKERNVAKQIKKNEPVLLDAPPIKENGQKQKTA